MKNVPMKELQEKVDFYIQQNGGYWSPLSMLASIMEELGEISRELNAFENFKPKKTKDSSFKEKLREEMGDSLFSLICLANYFQIELDQALLEVIKKYETRDQGRFT